MSNTSSTSSNNIFDNMVNVVNTTMQNRAKKQKQKDYGDNIDNPQDIANKRLMQQKDMINTEHKNFKTVIRLIITYVIIILFVSIGGANLLFYTWAAHNCNQKILDYFFETNDPQVGGGEGSKKMGGNGNCEKAISNNDYSGIDISEICKYDKKELNISSKSESGIFGFLEKINEVINKQIKYIIEKLPMGKMCGITFLFSPIIILGIAILSIALFVGACIYELYKTILNTEAMKLLSDFFYANIVVTVIIILICLPFIFHFLVLGGFLYSFKMLYKLLIQPLFLMGKKNFFNIIGNNLNILNFITFIYTLRIILNLKHVVNNNTLTGIWIGFGILTLYFLVKFLMSVFTLS